KLTSRRCITRESLNRWERATPYLNYSRILAIATYSGRSRWRGNLTNLKRDEKSKTRSRAKEAAGNRSTVGCADKWSPRFKRTSAMYACTKMAKQTLSTGHWARGRLPQARISCLVGMPTTLALQEERSCSHMS